MLNAMLWVLLFLYMVSPRLHTIEMSLHNNRYEKELKLVCGCLSVFAVCLCTMHKRIVKEMSAPLFWRARSTLCISSFQRCGWWFNIFFWGKKYLRQFVSLFSVQIFSSFCQIPSATEKKIAAALTETSLSADTELALVWKPWTQPCSGLQYTS